MNISLLKPCKTLADVGCDHAYSSIYAVEKGLARACLACDIRKGPLEIARKNIEAAGLEDKIKTVLTDGLVGLEPGSLDAILISGMGGITITHILDQGLEVVKAARQMILQPQSDASLVRKRVHELGFYINEEKCIYDEGKFYTCLSCINGQSESYEEEFMYQYGKYLLDNRDELLIKQLSDKYKKLEAIKANCEKQGRSDNLLELNNELNLLHDALGYMGKEV